MLVAPPCVRAVPGFVSSAVSDQSIVPACGALPNSHCCSTSQLSIQLIFRTTWRSRGSKSASISCQSSRGSFGDGSNNGNDPSRDYIEAVVLISETTRHYGLRNRGFEEGTKWHTSSQLHPFTLRAKEPRADANSIGVGFLRRFQSPTIFLKISCDGDFLLPIIVGEFAIERLVEAFRDDEDGDSPNEFQFVKNLVEELGYEVTMVRITERLVNTYLAKIYFTKPGEKDIFSVDARPSDAINVANRCKAPIYVNKHIVLTDAIRIAYGLAGVHDKKAVYDVSLDSAADGPDFLAEELGLLRSMSLAVEEEKYTEAAICRDRLLKLRKLIDEH